MFAHLNMATKSGIVPLNYCSSG